MNDDKVRYPFDTRCSICGKTAGIHNAVNYACPVGRRGRAGTYSFHSVDRFHPRMPRISKELKVPLEAFRLSVVPPSGFMSDRQTFLWWSALMKIAEATSKIRRPLKNTPEWLK